MSELDPKLTFDSFVVGPANRLASAAAKRAADSPGTSYNPLFLCSAPGLGKTHILTAIAHKSAHADAKLKVEYMALEEYLDRLEGSLQIGESDGLRGQYGELDILLLDDVQFLTGQPEAQEMLLKTLDQLTAAGGQIVLASDRPPADINGLDARLLSRFSGGLIVDLGAPEYETRVAIINKKAIERGQTLEPGVAEAVAKAPLKNVRELGGVLNKIFATQELDERRVSLDEVGALMAEQDKAASLAGSSNEFGNFLSELASSVAEVVEEREAPWRKAIREIIDSAERQGFSAARIEALQDGPEPKDWKRIVEAFRADLLRLHEIDNELQGLGNPWPEAAQGVLEDPDRIEEAEALLTSVRERQRPFPSLGAGPQLHDLDGFDSMAVKAAAQLVGAERPEYNPLYIWSTDEGIARTMLGALGRTYQEANPEERMAVSSVSVFASDFIRALGEGVAGAWRERWWTVDLLLVHGIQGLSETERAQDEFFHLFEALRRRGARMMLVADRPPAAIESIDDRLRSRFEGGLVLELSAGTASDLELVEPEVEPGDKPFVPGLDPTRAGGESRKAEPAPVPVAVSEPKKGGAWFPSTENVVLNWPRLDDLLVEELE
jgi:chromosomal replication initiation ATPase DnaA